MQFPLQSLLFTQLPGFFQNLTAPSSVPASSSIDIETQTPSPQVTPAIDLTMDSSKPFELPKLPYAYNALEPQISEQIMTIHHTKHHQTYVTNLNAAIKDQVQALSAGDVQKQISLQQAIKFNGGGHINHSLFWLNLVPASSPAAKPSSAPALTQAINKKFGSVEKFEAEFKALLLGIQGSGWGWLVKNTKNGEVELLQTKDQDPVASVPGKEAVFGVDLWEHAYYLQYYNDKKTYVDNIMKVINWEVAEQRFTKGVGELKL